MGDKSIISGNPYYTLRVKQLETQNVSLSEPTLSSDILKPYSTATEIPPNVNKVLISQPRPFRIVNSGMSQKANKERVN